MKSIRHGIAFLIFFVFIAEAQQKEYMELFKGADNLIKRGDYNGARVEYEKLRSMPAYGKELALFNIAESYRLEKNYDSAHQTFEEIMKIDNMGVYYQLYALSEEAKIYLEQENHDKARQLYDRIIKTHGALPYHIFRAQVDIGDSYKREMKYSQAKGIYENLLKKEETSVFPNDGYRLELKERLEEIEGLKDGMRGESAREQRSKWVNSPKQGIYVSLQGDDSNPGTKERPFATIKKAQEEVIRLKEKGMPKGGVVVYLRGGRYFLEDNIVFQEKDSGIENAPVVYRSYPGEEAKITGGRQITNFKPLSDPDIIRRLPDEAKDRIWVADLKEAGITEYGQLLNRGMGRARPGALELICNGTIMKLARWPNEGWVRVAGLTQVDGKRRNTEYQIGKFIYSGDRPDRWTEEKDMWAKGYLGVSQPYCLTHMKIGAINTNEKTISLLPNTLPGAATWWAPGPVARNHPYFVYNILSELDAPGEFYLDRDTGKLYFYPPDDIKKSEVIATTLDKPVFSFEDTSNIVLMNLLIEGTWQHGIVMNKGRNNLVAGCTIRNTGQFAVRIESGWEHGVVGCDMYDMGEGGVAVDGGDREKLIPSRHTVENNHIYRFNRFCGGYRQGVQVNGVGQTVSHNVIHDAPHQLIYFNANDHVIEFNELYDGPYEGGEIGTMYIYGEPWYLMNRGTVIRNNFLHHINSHSSPNLTHGVTTVHIDAMNAGLVLTKNIFYKTSNGISNTYPGNYLTENIFVDVENRGIGHDDRSAVFYKNSNIEAGPNLYVMANLSELLRNVNYKQPPWSYRYPPLVGIMEKEPEVWGKIQGSIIRRNVNIGQPLVIFRRGSKGTTLFENNWDGEDPMFRNKEEMDFEIRPGSPVYGRIGYEPIKMKNIGVYRDELRASWPIDKYYRPDSDEAADMKSRMTNLKRISPPLYYDIPARKGNIEIDGDLKKDEWFGLDKGKAMVIDRYFNGENKEGAKTYAWLQHERDFIYIALANESDPWNENMPLRRKEHLPVFEIDIESQAGSHSRGWWMEDMPTGPIYIIWGSFDGKWGVHNNFGMPFNAVKTIEQAIEYKLMVQDKENLCWTSEMKIPLGNIGINPIEANMLAFNIGVSKRGGWFAWVPTGGSTWRIENAGFIKFNE